MRPIRLALAAGVLLIAGCGGSSSPAQTASGQRGPGGFASAQLAKALGVSQSKLQSALQSIMPQGRRRFRGGQGAPPAGGGHGGPPPGGRQAGARGGPGFFGGQLAAQLAKKLGIPEAKVTKAFQSLRPPQPGA